MVKCSFSGKEIPKGQGIMFVRRDGQILWFANRKCEQNYVKLQRKAVHYKWTTAYQKGRKHAVSEEQLQEAKNEAKE